MVNITNNIKINNLNFKNVIKSVIVWFETKRLDLSSSLVRVNFLVMERRFYRPEISFFSSFSVRLCLLQDQEEL